MGRGHGFVGCFRMSVVDEVACEHVRQFRCGQNLQVYRSNFNDRPIYSIILSDIISSSGLGGHIVISGCRPNHCL